MTKYIVYYNFENKPKSQIVRDTDNFKPLPITEDYAKHTAKCIADCYGDYNTTLWSFAPNTAPKEIYF